MRRHTAIPGATVIALWLCVSTFAADAPAPSAAEEALKAKGLTRANSLYLVEGDVKLPERLKAVRAAKKQEDDYKAKRTLLERQLKNARANVSDYAALFEKLHVDMLNTSKTDTRRYNQLVGQTNALQNRIDESKRLIAQKQKELDSLSDPHARYVTALLELSDAMESAAAQYKELADDAAVKAALAKVNEKPGPKFRLGPSNQFAEELPRVRKQREPIVSAPLKVTFRGGTPEVEATLNGKVTQRMTFDSGAASVTVSWKTAEQAGVTPGPGDPTVPMVVADGKRVESKLMVLESVQVGPFTVRNVECLVLPQSAGDVAGLLGGTFLRHFSYRSDLAAGELHMTQLDEPDAKTVATKRASDAGSATAAVERVGAKGNGSAVPASGNWTQVSFTVEAGKCYLVKARGTWTGSMGPLCGPEGLCPPELFHVLGPQPFFSQPQKEYYLGQHPRHALLGRIGSEKWDFYVGAECRFIAPSSGPLSFKMNDTASAAPQRSGRMTVTAEEVAPEWLDAKGQVDVIARIDDQDRLHLTPDGLQWEWGGSWGKVGLHDGFYPTVVNGIYWWPRWSDAKHTDPLVARDIWPKDPSKFAVAQVKAQRGKVEVIDRSASEIVLRFGDDGLGSSQVTAVLSTGNPSKPPTRSKP